MTSYPNLDELEKLWPEEGYAVIIEDEFKPPDSDDFVNMLSQFEQPDFELPSSKQGYSYWVHDADGNSYNRQEWQKHKAMHKVGNAVQTVREQEDVEKTLEDLKVTGREWWEREDVLWFELVLSLATQGGSRGAELVVDEANNIVEERYNQVSFETIKQMEPANRWEKLNERLLAANVPRQDQTTDALIENFERVEQEYGTPTALKDAFRELNGGDEKVRFLKKFKRIGDKYARNIGMDLYHPDFRNYFAIDYRIKKVLEAADYDLEVHDDYEEQEAFLCGVADELGIEPWAVDRILYQYNENVLAEL